MRSLSHGGLALLLLAPLIIHAAPKKTISADADYLGCVNALFSVNSDDEAKAITVMAFPGQSEVSFVAAVKGKGKKPMLLKCHLLKSRFSVVSSILRMRVQLNAPGFKKQVSVVGDGRGTRRGFESNEDYAEHEATCIETTSQDDLKVLARQVQIAMASNMQDALRRAEYQRDHLTKTADGIGQEQKEFIAANKKLIEDLQKQDLEALRSKSKELLGRSLAWVEENIDAPGARELKVMIVNEFKKRGVGAPGALKTAGEYARHRRDPEAMKNKNSLKLIGEVETAINDLDKMEFNLRNPQSETRAIKALEVCQDGGVLPATTKAYLQEVKVDALNPNSFYNDAPAARGTR